MKRIGLIQSGHHISEVKFLLQNRFLLVVLLLRIEREIEGVLFDKLCRWGTNRRDVEKFSTYDTLFLPAVGRVGDQVTRLGVVERGKASEVRPVVVGLNEEVADVLFGHIPDVKGAVGISKRFEKELVLIIFRQHKLF